MHLKRDCVERRISGTFSCPVCDSDQPRRKVLDKQYITFLDFPLFSFQETQTGVECATCRVKFTFRELDHYESTKEGRGQTPAVFAGSAVRSVLRMVGADANLNDDLMALLLSGFRYHSGGDEVEPEDVISIRASMATGESVVANVCELATILTGEQRQMLSRHLLDAARCYREKDVSTLADDLCEILAE